MNQKLRWREKLALAIQYALHAVRVKPVRPKSGQNRHVNVYYVADADTKLPFYFVCRKPADLAALQKQAEESRRKSDWEFGAVCHRSDDESQWLVTIPLAELHKMVFHLREFVLVRGPYNEKGKKQVRFKFPESGVSERSSGTGKGRSKVRKTRDRRGRKSRRR